MHERFADRFCASLPGAVRHEPFGPDMAVWKVAGYMFAAYTLEGQGLSLRASNAIAAQLLISQGRAVSAPYLQGGGWVLFPWETTPDELRLHIRRSYDTVRQENPVSQD